MNSLNHYIFFLRTGGHCATWLARASSLRDAMLHYALEQCAGAELREDGCLLVDDGCEGQFIYEHPLACIEAEEKTWERGRGWNGWEVRQLQPQHWEAAFAEVFCSEDPSDVEDYIERCRPLLHQHYPRSRARAFVWYLKDGPLVTFYRQERQRCVPMKVLGRYHLPWEQGAQVCEWTGSYDDILAQMATEYPLP